MRRLFAACLLPLLLAAAGCNHTEAIQDVRDATLPAGADGLSRDAIGRKLAEAASRARWHVDRAGPTQILATYDAGRHSATVAISWTERTYSISLVSSENLKEQGGQIHRAYNGWVRGLEREIDNVLYAGDPAGAAPPPPARVATAAAPAVPAPLPAAAAPRFGDSVPFACPEPGTVLEFKSGAKLVFAAAEGVYCPYESGGRRQLATAFGIYDRDSAKEVARLWPLKLGKQITFLRLSGQASYRERYRVARRVSVTVRAGTFDAFLIDWSSATANATVVSAYSESGSFWYAPALGWIVKTQHDPMGGGYARLGNDEVVRITHQ